VTPGVLRDRAAGWRPEERGAFPSAWTQDKEAGDRCASRQMFGDADAHTKQGS